MPCTPFSINGVTGFVCGPKVKPKRCACGSGRPADLLCDWKVEGGTCDAKICAACSTAPEEGKDLCPTHAVAFRSWLERRGPSSKETGRG